jgi:hypothetical protein
MEDEPKDTDEAEIDMGEGGCNKKEDKFPYSFRCTLTHYTMAYPMAIPLKEKQSWIEMRMLLVSSIIYYPNRALKAIIEGELEHRQQETGTLLGSLPSSAATTYHRQLPDSFYCPITLELINKAVIDPDGKIPLKAQ